MLSTEKRQWSSMIFELTGEPIGETEWRRWWTEDGWHAKTPRAILDEYGWLMDSSLEMPEGFGERQDQRERERRQ